MAAVRRLRFSTVQNSNGRHNFTVRSLCCFKANHVVEMAIWIFHRSTLCECAMCVGRYVQRQVRHVLSKRMNGSTRFGASVSLHSSYTEFKSVWVSGKIRVLLSATWSHWTLKNFPWHVDCCKCCQLMP